jgi:hypothetical protein
VLESTLGSAHSGGRLSNRRRCICRTRHRAHLGPSAALALIFRDARGGIRTPDWENISCHVKRWCKRDSHSSPFLSSLPAKWRENGGLAAPLELCRQISDIQRDSGLLG